MNSDSTFRAFAGSATGLARWYEIDHAALTLNKSMVMLTFAHGDPTVLYYRISSCFNSVAKPVPVIKR
jgi:phage shock protein PspC (stress-responsive transcriptional regulator)|tara:strand:- start:38 stop:241 length:204 start_codon:yes stop_codon:yes gene_type:complete